MRGTPTVNWARRSLHLMTPLISTPQARELARSICQPDGCGHTADTAEAATDTLREVRLGGAARLTRASLKLRAVSRVPMKRPADPRRVPNELPSSRLSRRAPPV
jgi:hypothetical protein